LRQKISFAQQHIFLNGLEHQDKKFNKIFQKRAMGVALFCFIKLANNIRRSKMNPPSNRRRIDHCFAADSDVSRRAVRQHLTCFSHILGYCDSVGLNYPL
jgi:hypothetical protein